MPNNIEEWIKTLKDEDQRNVASFLEATCEFFQRHATFLRGSGYYAVGSSVSGRTYVFKGEGYEAAIAKIGKEESSKLIERFGEKLGEYMGGCYGKQTTLTKEEITEIDEAIKQCNKERRIKHNCLFERPQYEDIDLVLAGLPREKANPQLDIWKDFSNHLRTKFPNAAHPTNADNGFSYWDIYCDDKEMIVRDYRIEIPAFPKPTQIHFMLFHSDESAWFFAGLKDQKKDISLEVWKELQSAKSLPYISILEL